MDKECKVSSRKRKTGKSIDMKQHTHITGTCCIVILSTNKIKAVRIGIKRGVLKVEGKTFEMPLYFI